MIVPGSFLEGVEPASYAAFIDDAERGCISRFASAFPIPVHAHGLEFHLGAEATHADYLACLKDDPATVARIVAADAGQAVGSRIWRFLAAWAASSDLRAHLPLLWLEYDRPDGAFADPPGLFVALAEQRDTGSALSDVLTTLFHQPGDRIANVDAARRILPAGARVRHVGAMPSRDPRFLRLVIEGLAADSIPEWLDTLTWPGEFEEVERLLAAATHAPALVDLDYLDVLQPSLGVEFLLTGNGAPRDGGAGLLDWLTDAGLCTAGKRDALARWLTWRVRETDGEPVAFWEKLYHVKVTLKPGATGAGAQLAAKGYLGTWGGPTPSRLSELQAAMGTLGTDSGSSPG